MIKKYDLDANGQISYEEFHTMMGWTDPVPASASKKAPAAPKVSEDGSKTGT